MTALLKFDLTAYVEYNVMALPLLGAVLVGLHLKILPKKTVFGAVVFAVLILNAVYYICRLCNGGLDFL